MSATVFLLMVVVFVVIIFAARGVRVVRPWQKGVIERLGKYTRTAGSGITLIIPFLDSMDKVDMREQVVDVPPQEVITRDNVVVTVDAVVYYEATDPVKLIYNVADFYTAATKLAQTNLRNVIGEMTLDDTLTSRDRINTELRGVLDEATDKWGTRVVRVEIQRIDPPADVTEAMHRQMKAERERRAMILQAEGEKQASIEVATGQKQATILEAEGQAQAIREVADAEKYEKTTVADGEAEAIAKVYGAIHEGDPTNDLIAIKYLEALQGIADGQATKIFLPLEATGVMGAIGGIGELFRVSGAGEGAVDSEAPDRPAAPKPQSKYGTRRAAGGAMS
ncbi:MAG: SPFH/Band 7/PHB domain protein [Acidobacteria bacterium]|nr:SPFH/Band 7/PHB domain protein [Acidobacteriota bacterium]